MKLPVVALLCYSMLVQAQKPSRLLDSIVRSVPQLSAVAAARGKYQPQIIYTQINRNKNGVASFTDHQLYLDTNRYFYCASLVKLPCSILALEKINSLKVPGLTRESPMITDSSGFCHTRTARDTSSTSGYPSVAHHIRKMLLVSDNNSYSRIFEFLGPEHIQKRMTELGFPKARIIHRFDPRCSGAGNRLMNPVTFLGDSGEVIYRQPADSVEQVFTPPLQNMTAGRDIYNKRKKLVATRKDFSNHNFLSLKMIHGILRDLVFAGSGLEQRYGINEGDRAFLLMHLGMYPRESLHPKYPKETYFDAYKKYFIYGGNTQVIESDTIRIFNIVGRAYGYIADCAYIVNISTGLEYMVSAVLYTNKRNTFGSGVYEYDTVGLPFLKELSLALYRFESRRKKKYLPDLSSFNFYSGSR